MTSPAKWPVDSPFSRVTTPLTMVARMPSAFWTSRRAPPGKSLYDCRQTGAHPAFLEEQQARLVALLDEAAGKLNLIYFLNCQSKKQFKNSIALLFECVRGERASCPRNVAQTRRQTTPMLSFSRM